MRRTDIDKNIKAKTIKTAAEKFAEYLAKKGYDWAAEEVIECVNSGFYCMSNAYRHNLVAGKVTYPTTSDWSYFWAIENVDGSNNWYAWFIERT